MGKEEPAFQACHLRLKHPQNLSHRMQWSGVGAAGTKLGHVFTIHYSGRGSYPEPNVFPSSYPLQCLKEDGKKGKAKEGREEGRGNTGIESTGDQEKSWIGR